jgi:hypothetical protein
MARALLSNGSVSEPRQYGNCVFYAARAKQKDEDIGSLLPGNAAVNIHPQQWETVFSVGSVKRSYLKIKRRYSFEFWVLGGRWPRKFRRVKTLSVIWKLHSCVILGVCDSVLLCYFLCWDPLPGDDYWRPRILLRVQWWTGKCVNQRYRCI